MDVSSLQFPKKSHRKSIIIPKENMRLAELMGIVIGDGGINNDWQLVISMNSVADLEYSYYVTRLLEELFAIKVRTYKRPNQNTLILVSSSTTLVDFLITKGAVRGNKILQNIATPLWILGNAEYKKQFVRGLVDTDGCLYIHKHTINGKLFLNIGFCFTSYSTKLLQEVAIILKEFDIVPHITYGSRRIYLYSMKAVLKYLDVFGTSNPRISGVLQQWRGARAV